MDNRTIYQIPAVGSVHQKLCAAQAIIEFQAARIKAQDDVYTVLLDKHLDLTRKIYAAQEILKCNTIK